MALPLPPSITLPQTVIVTANVNSGSTAICVSTVSETWIGATVIGTNIPDTATLSSISISGTFIGTIAPEFFDIDSDLLFLSELTVADYPNGVDFLLGGVVTCDDVPGAFHPNTRVESYLYWPYVDEPDVPRWALKIDQMSEDRIDADVLVTIDTENQIRISTGSTGPIGSGSSILIGGRPGGGSQGSGGDGSTPTSKTSSGFLSVYRFAAASTSLGNGLIASVRGPLVYRGRDAIQRFVFAPLIGDRIVYKGIEGYVKEIMPTTTTPNGRFGIVVTLDSGIDAPIYYTDPRGLPLTAQDVARAETNELSPPNRIVAISYAEYEEELNEARSSIRVVNPAYIRAFVQQYRDALNA